MTAAAASISMHENPVVKELLELFLKTPGFHAERKDYKAPIDGVGAISKQYNSIWAGLNEIPGIILAGI